MLSYKYSFDEIYDRPLLPGQPREGKQSWITTLTLIPIQCAITVVLVLYSPFKGLQLLLEKFSS